jgi:acyl carrier protein
VDQAPLCRLTLVRTGDAAWTLVWSNHHLLLDRWSWPIVLREVGAAYQALRAGGRAELASATPWRRYLAWLAERDAVSTEAFWRAELAGIEATALRRLAGAGENGGGERRLDLTVDETARLAALARERRVTVNTLVSAAWALWLARATARTDVVFGLAVSGRPEEVAGIERLVGMCINNVPSRVRVDPAEPLSALLGRIESSQAAAGPHAHAALTDLQRWSELPWHHRLFDTLLVFQHHGADDETVNWLGASHPVRMDGGETRTNYPLALVVSGKEALALRLAYHGRFAGAEGADRVLAELRAVLSALVSLGGGPVGDAMAVVAAPPAVDGNGAEAERVVTPPRTDAEWVVAHVWAELLGRDEVGIDENFFDLGGQSLVATQIMSRVRDGFQMELPVSLLFEHPTVEAFAAAVRRRERAPGRVERIAGIIRRVEEMTVQELREAGIHE